MTEPTAIDEFVRRWEQTGAAERANYQIFLIELCDLIGVERPEGSRSDASQNSYVFDHPVLYNDGFDHISTNWIDLYKRGCFVLEAKQGSDRTKEAGDALGLPRASRRGTAVRGTRGWDSAMLEAKGQAERYARALPPSDGWPPFLVVVDVGHSIELYADFTRSGKTYVAFPDSRTHRLALADLAREDVRERLRLVWTDPLALDPSRRSAKVTREVAERLARLAKSLEGSGHEPEAVAQFLMRCLFTMFAEDVELIPEQSFSDLLKSRRGKVESFPAMVGSLWQAMDKGDYHPILERKLPRFNGLLFASTEAPPLSKDQLELLIEAASADWRDVEPAIFGTLLERALDPVERHKLGAHYTPRAYVERLVLPTIVEPLREEWADTLAAALLIAKEAEADFQRAAESRQEKLDRVALERRRAKWKEARGLLIDFLSKLCTTRVLDPACGTGNFLYVAMEHMKRLEGEIRDALARLAEEQAPIEGAGLTVDPRQFLGIEINPRAAAIAELVLWIGHLQWHFRTVGKRLPAEPILHAYHNIECRDAILAYDRKEIVLNEHGHPVTRWDGRTMKRHPVTGEDVPDETSQIPEFRFINSRVAGWPRADFIVGNPPFIGNKKMRYLLGENYTNIVRNFYKNVEDSVDFVMYWWEKAACLLEKGALRRFGFITTNSIRMTFNRSVLLKHLGEKRKISLVYVIPEHPWVQLEDGANVDISMTVSERSDNPGVLATATAQERSPDGSLQVKLQYTTGTINPDLTIGVNITELTRLKSNKGLACPGVQLSGQGFVLPRAQIQNFSARTIDDLIRNYYIGNDLIHPPTGNFVIDAFGLDETRLMADYPDAYQWLKDRVKPERDHNPRASYRTKWWIYSEPRGKFRNALLGLSRIIVTCRTAKHRFFTIVNADSVAETTVVLIALDDPAFLGILSSRAHVLWCLSSKATLEDRPRYNTSVCFDTFAFPKIEKDSFEGLGKLAILLDNHRKRQQALHPTLIMTDVYNVLEKLRSGEPLTDKEKVTHEQGLISVLKQIHDDLDAAVFDAYGWPRDLSDALILERLVALNAERASEEARGLVRWLRPEFQDPKGKSAAPVQSKLAIVEAEPEVVEVPSAKVKKTPWPESLAEQVQAVRSALNARPVAVTPEALARTFLRAKTHRVAEVLETLETLGHARSLGDGRYARA